MLRYPLNIAERRPGPLGAGAWRTPGNTPVRRERRPERPGDLPCRRRALSGANCCPIRQQGLAFLLGARPLPAGRRNGPGQDRAGAGVSGRDVGLSRHSGGAAAPDPQLAAGTRPVFRRTDICACTSYRGLTPYELPEADVYIIHYLLLRGWKDVLPELGLPHGHLRRNAGAAPQRHAASIPPPACFPRPAKTSSAFPERPFTTRAARSGTWSTFSIFTSWAIGRAFPGNGATATIRAMVAKPELLGRTPAPGGADAAAGQARRADRTGSPSGGWCRKSTGTTRSIAN